MVELSNEDKLSLLKIINDTGIKKLVGSINVTSTLIDGCDFITDDIIKSLVSKLEVDRKFLEVLQSQLSTLSGSAVIHTDLPNKSVKLPDLRVDKEEYAASNWFQRLLAKLYCN